MCSTKPICYFTPEEIDAYRIAINDMPYDPFFKKQSARPPMDHITMFNKRHTGPQSEVLMKQFREKRQELDALVARNKSFSTSTK